MNPIDNLVKYECEYCNVKEREENKTRCEPCNFAISSDDRKSKSKVSLGSTPKAILRDFIPNYTTYFGKTKFMFFYHHPELNFKLPPLPKVDIWGRPVSPTDFWVFHHEDGNNHNDRVDNVILCLASEHHAYFEKITRQQEDPSILKI